jgi:hypothetical protein
MSTAPNTTSGTRAGGRLTMATRMDASVQAVPTAVERTRTRTTAALATAVSTTWPGTTQTRRPDRSASSVIKATQATSRPATETPLVSVGRFCRGVLTALVLTSHRLKAVNAFVGRAAFVRLCRKRPEEQPAMCN